MYTLDYSDAILLYYLFFTKILPFFVTFICDKHFNIKIKFKSLSLLNACIQNIHVKYAGYEISVAELGLKSKYFSSEYKKPFCVELEDVKINRASDLEAPRTQSKEKMKDTKKLKVDSNDNLESKHVEWTRETSTKFLNYLLQLVPPTTMILLQFLGFYIKNISTTVNNKEKGPVSTLKIPNLELIFDGCVIKNSRTLFIALALNHINSKFFAYNKQNPSRKPHHACLAEVVVDVSVEARVSWSEKKLLYEKLQVSINNTQVTFFGGLFDMIEHFMLHTKLKLPSTQSIEAAPEAPVKTNASVDINKLIETLTPQLLVIHLQSTEVKSLNKQNSFHYHLLLHRLEMKGNFKSTGTSRLKLSNLRIYTPVNEVLYLKEICVDVKSNGNVFIIGTRINTLEVLYHHDDIYGWFKKIILAGVKSNRKELIMRAFRIMNERMVELLHSELTQKLFARIVVNHLVDAIKIAIVLKLDDAVSTISVAKIKFRITQDLDLRRNCAYHNYLMNLMFQMRQWTLELITDGPFSWVMSNKIDHHHGDSFKTYIRGSAVFVGKSLIEFTAGDEKLSVSLRVNTLRTEYSQKFTAFVIKSIKSSKEYIDLFSQLNSNEKNESKSDEKETISMEKIFNGIALDAKVSNISCFFINRHDVCIFVSLTEISSHESSSYALDTFQVSAVDFTKYESVYDLSEFSTIHVSTKTLKINVLEFVDEQPQIAVDFVEKLECSWNAHFLRHLLSLVRDFHRFKRNAEDAMGVVREQKFSLPRSLPVGLDIKKLRNIRIKHSDVNVDRLFSLINEFSGENLFFYSYF